jgi:predicted SnoaL-like aldol condensation-catalyzing enzyme
MKRLTLTLAALLVAAVALVAQAPATPTPVQESNGMNAQEKANLKMVLDWWREVIQSRHVELAPKYQAETYMQHNPNILTGRDAFVKVFGARPPVDPIPPAMAAPPVVQFAKGDYVGFIWERTLPEPGDSSTPPKRYAYNNFDLVRLENGKVAEHWDYALKTKGSPDGGTQDSATAMNATFKPSAAEQKNLEIANVEFHDILQYGHTELAQKVMAPGYIQHNPNVPGGRDGFVAFFSKIRQPEPLKAEWKNKPMMIIPSGQFVFYMSKRELDHPDDATRKYTTYWFDIVRVDNGMIQEHWDAAIKNPPAPARGVN